MKALNVLIVEDEANITRIVKLYLEKEGFDVQVATDGAAALQVVEADIPDLIVLDLNLPEIDGIEVCRKVRQSSDVPIIMLTARTEEEDRLKGLNLGADDYITKPFSPREVVARVKAVLRRANPNAGVGQSVLNLSDLTIDSAAHRVFLGDLELDLTPSEFDILAVLARNEGRVLTRMQLLDETQGVAYEGYERSIDQHIKNLRKKIEDDASHTRIIHTVHGVGYRLDMMEETV